MKTESAMPFSRNVDLVGYHDLQDRPGFKLAIQQVSGRWFLYVAHLWEGGVSIIDVTDPRSPRLERFIAGPPNTWTHQIQVAKGVMVTNYEHRLQSWGGDPGQPYPEEGLAIWDVRDPVEPKMLGRWRGGGNGTHRNYYDGGRYIHSSASVKGFKGKIYAVIDIGEPARPRTVGQWWVEGQRVEVGETFAARDAGLHIDLHGAPYPVGRLVFCPWSAAGMVILDIADVTKPRLVSRLNVSPPLGSRIAMHTCVPLPGGRLVVINSESLNERCDEPLNFTGIADVSKIEAPRLVSLFPNPEIPAGYSARDFIEKGGRFGPHNQHQPQGHPEHLPADRYVYMTYFNAGLQVFDIENPYFPRIAGYYIADDPPKRLGVLPKDLVIQAEDVLVDRRGYCYVTEKNTGLHVYSFAGHRHLH
jgi:hypothetical protein